MPVPVDKLMEILNEMFRFRRLLATPKSVNVEGGVEEMSSATTSNVVFTPSSGSIQRWSST